MNQVQKITEPETAVSPDTANIIQIISRAASDPNVDIDKMERLLQMQERIMEREAKRSYTEAFAAMQTTLPEIAEKGKGHGNIRYALWEDVNKAIRPILADHGFGLSFRVSDADNGIKITAVLSHRNGHSEETARTFPADKSGSKNDIQAVGSAISYGKRYTASALLNITSRDEPDDNGYSVGLGAKINEKQAEQLREMIDETDSDAEKFCKYYRINALPDLPAAKFEDALKALKSKQGTTK